MTRKITSCLDVGTKTKRRGLDSFSKAPRRHVPTKTEKATIETGCLAAKREETEEWGTFYSSSGCTLKSGSQPSTTTSSFTSSEENDNNSYVGIFTEKARALANCMPSRSNRDGLAFKKNTNALNGYDEFDTLRIEIEELSLNIENTDHSSKLLRAAEFLQDVEDSFDERIFIPASTSTPKEQKIDLVNKQIKVLKTLLKITDSSDQESSFVPSATSTPKEQIIDSSNLNISRPKALSKILDSSDEERFIISAATATPKKQIIYSSNVINGPVKTSKVLSTSSVIGDEKLTSEPVSKGKVSPLAVSKKLARYRKMISKVPVCDIITTKCSFPFP